MNPSRISLAAVALWACADRLECGDGTREVNGICEADTPTGAPTTLPTTTQGTEPTLDDVLAALPDCTPGVPGAGLDFALGCADGGCVGDTLADLDAAYGETATCVVWDFSSDVFCDWSNGVGTSFADEDGDQLADPGDTASYLSVDLPYAGTDSSGLGLELAMGCFFEALGAPTGATFTALGPDEWALQTLEFDDDGVWVNDYFGSGYAFEPDGAVDNLFILGV